MVMNLENLLLKSANNQDYSEALQNVTDFYGDDINRDMLETQLAIFKLQFKENLCIELMT